MSISEFNTPENLDSIVWRYMKFNRFTDLIKPYEHYDGTFPEQYKANGLYLRRSDLFDDPLEGTYPEIVMFREDSHARRNSKTIWQPHFRQSHFVSCWTIRDEELQWMWDNYGQISESIAIKTTYRRLRDSLDSQSFTFEISKINYDDHPTIEISDARYPPDALRIKDADFWKEKELRIVVQEAAPGQATLDDVENTWERDDHITSVLRPFSAFELINEIVMNPNSAVGFIDEVENALDEWGLSSIPVVSSSLST